MTLSNKRCRESERVPGWGTPRFSTVILAGLVAAACSGSSGGGGSGGAAGSGGGKGGSAGRGSGGSGGSGGGSAGRGGSSGAGGTGGIDAGGEGGEAGAEGGGTAGTSGRACYGATAGPGGCVRWRDCEPGERVSREGTASSDRECTACDEGTYSGVQNGRECRAWRDCPAGDYVWRGGTSSLDRDCSACPAETASTELNSVECSPWKDCERGTFVSQTATRGRDRECTACPPETFSAGENAVACTALTVCSEGEYVTVEPSSTANRQCAPCPVWTFSEDENAEACEPWTDCVEGEYQSGAPSDTADRACAACVGGYTTVWNRTECTPWTECTEGQYVSVQGSPTTNQTCAGCPAGTFSTGTNAAQCAPWTLCVPGESLTTKGTSTTDQSCAACSSGQTSLGMNAHRCSPAQIEAGDWHTCMVGADGNVTCWGWSPSGGLGYGNGNDIGDDEAPVTAGHVGIGGPVVELASGNSFNCALLVNGSVRCWGWNDNGRLGYGHATNIGDNELPSSAGDVPVGGTVKHIATGVYHACAVLANGSVRCWGGNGVGQLGYGHTNAIGDNETPASAGDVDVGGTVEQIVAGNAHTCALLSNGRVRCWGWGGYGQLGYGNTSAIGDGETPASAGDVDVGGTVVQLVAGHYHTCALLLGGGVRCWGFGAGGQLGYGNVNTIGDDETPASAGNVNVGGVVVQLAAGVAHVCALLENGAVRCWGRYENGRLGYAIPLNIGDNETPASAGDVNIGGTAVQITAGYEHTCALLTGDDVRCWGLNNHGQLGYGHMENVGDNEVPAGNVPYR
jgi:alpha-tubulin suppressor-like RCC1 family protein